MRRGLVVLFATVAAMALPHAALGSIFDSPAHGIPLLVDESSSGFALPPGQLTVPRGVVQLSTLVPKSAKGKHGIGIDGGPYKDIAGAPVKPGRMTSLTVDLPAGDYTVFDSYKNNRKRGYAVKLHVTHKRAKHVSFGERCPGFGGIGLSQTWVKGVSCSSATKLMDAVTSRWEADNDFAYTPIIEREFTCYISPFSSVGLKFTCLAGDNRVTQLG